MPEIIDDKSEHCIPFIVSHIRQWQDSHKEQSRDAPPFFIGLNGVQGAGKTTLVSTLCTTLSSEPLNLPTVELSIDDLYLPHEAQKTLAAAHPENPLVQHRGQPSTHDVDLGSQLFHDLKQRRPSVQIPSYDKSAYNGQGDRRGKSEWLVVNSDPEAKPIEVVIFEGWCVGFRALSSEQLHAKWQAAKEAAEKPNGQYNGQLGKLKYENVDFVNQQLKRYDALTDSLQVLMHIDAEDPQYVYQWRSEQETALRKAKGTGMTEEQVVQFVNGYYPSYEIYTDGLRKGVFERSGVEKQLRLVVGKDRKVMEVHKF